MPVGVIVSALSIFLGGVFGTLGGRNMSDSFKNNLNMILGVCSMAMGIYSISPMKNLSAVIFATILGTAFGLIIHLGKHVNNGAMLMQRGISKVVKSSGTTLSEIEFNAELVTVIVLFCVSGTGIYGSLTEGMTGDTSILISKAILDFFTAAVFATNLGYVVSMIAVPEFIILFALFAIAGVIYPLTTPTMILDFKAVGGLLMVASGFRMLKLKMFPTADMIPSMILIMPISWIWTTWVAPML